MNNYVRFKNHCLAHEAIPKNWWNYCGNLFIDQLTINVRLCLLNFVIYLNFIFFKINMMIMLTLDYLLK
jgi:hypothetical protein